MKVQEIKAVEMTRSIRDAHYERFKDRPIEDRIDFYIEQARKFEQTIKESFSRKQTEPDDAQHAR
jgi:hypothetical protein